MPGENLIPKKLTAFLVYSRPPLVFASMLCAIGIMWTGHSFFFLPGMLFLIISMVFDLVDGWFAARYQPDSAFPILADRVMDKVVYAIIFPVVSVGAMWRLTVIAPNPSRAELLHGVFILLICITVLVRDSFAHFMRGFAVRKGMDPEPTELTRIRTAVAAPVSALLYAHAFTLPLADPSTLYEKISTLGRLPLRWLFLIEILFLIINLGSIARYCKKYGELCLDELCLGDEVMRRRILSFFPNALTLMNALMGLLAVFFAYQERMREAYLILIGAAFFDKLDGALARKLGLTEPIPEQPAKRISLGGILDDIADTVSFCIAPAWMFVIVFSGVQDPTISRLPILAVAIGYCLLGVMRLLYFTFDKTPIPGFFKGMPTPAAALLVTAPLIMLSQAYVEAPVMLESVRFWGVFSFALTILTAVMMNVYPIRYLHLGRYMDKHPWFGRISGTVLLVSVFTPWFGHVGLLYMTGYLLSPLMTARLLSEAQAESKPDAVST